MITFTPLAGAARSTSTTPFAYILQVDDVRILLDCGSPDWMQEPSPFKEVQSGNDADIEGTTPSPPWLPYCESLKK